MTALSIALKVNRGMREGEIETATVLFGSAFPLLFWVSRALLLRRLSVGQALFLDLVLFLGSIPCAMSFIGWALNFPPDMGDHSPGVGVIFAGLVLVWIVCMMIWLFRLVLFAVRMMRAGT